MSKTWKESKAVKQGRSEKGRPKPKMEPYKKGTKNKKEIYGGYPRIVNKPRVLQQIKAM